MLPVGKLPPDLLARLLAQAPGQADPRLLLGPGLGRDCAILKLGEGVCLAVKTDPITFASDAIGWYAVQVNANDIAAAGAEPRWFLMTLLLPEKATSATLVEGIFNQVEAACREIGVTLIGGHTEITSGLERPILVGTLIGEFVLPSISVTDETRGSPLFPGPQPGNRLLLTKCVPIEATVLLAREFSDRILGSSIHPPIQPAELELARNYLYNPGLSVLRDARVARQAVMHAIVQGYPAAIHAMHDPTEGGLYTALWELAEYRSPLPPINRSAQDLPGVPLDLWVDLAAVPVSLLSTRICQALGLDPYGAIASGALLLAVTPEAVLPIQDALQDAGIPCSEIGYAAVRPSMTPPDTARGEPYSVPLDYLHATQVCFTNLSTDQSCVWRLPAGSLATDEAVDMTQCCLLPRPVRDEIARLYGG